MSGLIAASHRFAANKLVTVEQNSADFRLAVNQFFLAD